MAYFTIQVVEIEAVPAKQIVRPKEGATHACVVMHKDDNSILCVYGIGTEQECKDTATHLQQVCDEFEGVATKHD